MPRSKPPRKKKSQALAKKLVTMPPPFDTNVMPDREPKYEKLRLEGANLYLRTKKEYQPAEDSWLASVLEDLEMELNYGSQLSPYRLKHAIMSVQSSIEELIEDEADQQQHPEDVDLF